MLVHCGDSNNNIEVFFPNDSNIAVDADQIFEIRQVENGNEAYYCNLTKMPSGNVEFIEKIYGGAVDDFGDETYEYFKFQAKSRGKDSIEITCGSEFDDPSTYDKFNYQITVN